MIVLDVRQGSPEWHFARLGIPTASQFSRILSAKTYKVLAGSETYMHELLAEWLIGIPSNAATSGFMQRGTAMEPTALAYYEMQRDIKVTPAGVCLRDDRLAACSPDGLVGADGGVEIKCPSAKVHVSNMLGMSEDHFAQVQGNLWITGRTWWDLVSYHPEMPAAIVRFERHEEYLAALEKAMDTFIANLCAARATLIEQGAEPASALASEFVSTLTQPETVTT